MNTPVAASPMPLPRIRVSVRQALRIVGPYVYHHLVEQLIVVVPVCLYLFLFHRIVLQSNLERAGAVAAGVSLVVLGLGFFLDGVRVGLAPIGEIIGDTLPKKAGLATLLTFAFVMGLVGAFGEPVIGSLQIAGAGVDPGKAPLLHYMLIGNPLILTIVISVAAGIAVVLGTLRVVRGWSLKPIVLTLIGISIALTLAASRSPNLSSAIGLAWDAGAVIVGPVLCPLVLALGLGVSRATGRADTGMAGFGMVGLISIVPIASLVITACVLSWLGIGTASPPSVSHAAAGAASIASVVWDSILLSLRAIVPIFAFLYLFLRIKLRESGMPVGQLSLGIGLTFVGLVCFNLGLTLGLGDLGNQVGERLPATFHPPGQSLFPEWAGKLVVVAFGGVLGYGATLAEPAFNVLGQQVEDVTQGAFKKWIFSQAVALGVGIGAGLGMMSLVFHIPLLALLLPPYALLFVLTLFSDENYVNIAWDGGAVTTGPVTVPLKVAIGIALSHATGFAEGFGILALASAYPVLNILLLGLYVKRRSRKLHGAH